MAARGIVRWILWKLAQLRERKALTLQARSTALTLGSRSVALTLQARSTALTLGSRSVALTLQARSTALTLGSR